MKNTSPIIPETHWIPAEQRKINPPLDALVEEFRTHTEREVLKRAERKEVAYQKKWTAINTEKWLSNNRMEARKQLLFVMCWGK